MRERHRAGFTLVEVILAAALLAGLIIIITDLFPDILRIHSQENLSYQVNRETQRIMARLKEDIQTAGFRFLPPSGGVVNAIETPDEYSLTLRCISEVGQLAAQASSGDPVLSVSGFSNLDEAEALVWTYEGQSGYQPITMTNGSQVTISPPGLTYIGTRPLPAGTPLVAIRRIEYQIDKSENILVRRVNGTVTDRTAIDPAGTGFQYTVGTGTQNTLTPSDLKNLRFVNVSLRLVRSAPVPGGRRVTMTGSAVERITPLNLKSF